MQASAAIISSDGQPTALFSRGWQANFGDTADIINTYAGPSAATIWPRIQYRQDITRMRDDFRIRRHRSSPVMLSGQGLIFSAVPMISWPPKIAPGKLQQIFMPIRPRGQVRGASIAGHCAPSPSPPHLSFTPRLAFRGLEIRCYE